MLAEMSVYPLGTAAHLSGEVAKVMKELRRFDVEHQLGPMGTSLRGDPGRIFTVIEACLRELQKDHDRIIAHIVIDTRKGDEPTLRGMVSSVEDRLAL